MPGGNSGPGNFDPTPLPTDPHEGQEQAVDSVSTITAYRVPKNIRLNAIISNAAPRVKNALWIKPVEGGFAIYAKFNGKWQPLKMVDDGGTAPINDDEVPELATVGDYESAEATDDTIAGAKKYADGIGEALTGTSDDTYEDLTLNGLKKYIDKQINDLE